MSEHICFDPNCKAPIDGEPTWLGETYDGVEEEFPFHQRCADQPWPLYHTRGPKPDTSVPISQPRERRNGA